MLPFSCVLRFLPGIAIESQRNEIRLDASLSSNLTAVADASFPEPLVEPNEPEGNHIITSYLFGLEYPSLDALCPKNAFKEPKVAPPKTFEKLNLDIKSSSLNHPRLYCLMLS